MKIVGISVKNILINNIKDLYESAFPSDERREFGEFKQIMTENEHFHVYAFLEDNHFAGFITFWEWDEFCYGEHFAVLPEMRNGGKGSIYLQEITKKLGKPVVLEVEPPTDEMAIRRIGFYERNGFKLWKDITYIQPAYDKTKSSIELKLMTIGDIEFDGNNDKKIKRIKSEVYNFHK